MSAPSEQEREGKHRHHEAAVVDAMEHGATRVTEGVSCLMCPTCEGAGTVPERSDALGYRGAFAVKCERCDGAGSVWRCERCDHRNPAHQLDCDCCPGFRDAAARAELTGEAPAFAPCACEESDHYRAVLVDVEHILSGGGHPGQRRTIVERVRRALALRGAR